MSPLINRFVTLSGRTGLVVDLAARDFETSEHREYVAENYSTSTYKISPGDGGWRLLVLVDNKLEVWPASGVTVE